MKTLTLLIVTFLGLIGNAQNNLDSLWNIWNNDAIKDSTRLNAMSDIIWQGYLFKQPDSAFILADIEYKFAQGRNISRYQSDALNIKGISYAIRGNYPLAIDFFNQNLSFAEETKNLDLQAKMANNIAIIYRDQGKFIEADKYFIKALKVAEELDNLELQSKACNNLGISNMRQGNYAKGYEYIQRALNINLEINDVRGITALYNNIGNVYQKHGDYEKGMEYFKKALKLAEEKGYSKEMSSALTNIGLLHSYELDYEEAIIWHQKSLAIREEIEDKQGQSSSYSKIGNSYVYLGEFEKGIEYLNKSLLIEEELEEMGGIAIHKANKGWAYFKVAESIRETNGDSALIAYDLAYQLNLEAMELANEIGVDNAIHSSYNNLYNIAYDLDSIDVAYQYITALTERRDLNLQFNFFTLSEREKEIYFATMLDDYEKLLEFALIHQDLVPAAVEKAFNYVLKNKAITLKSSTAMRSRILSSEDTILIEKYNTWLDLREKHLHFQGTQAERDSIFEIARTIEKELAKTSVEFHSFEALNSMSWESVRSNLNKDEIAIEFIHFANYKTTDKGGAYAALLIAPNWDNPKFIKLCSGDDLNTLIHQFKGNNLEIVNGLYGKSQQLNSELYNLIWKPITPYVKGVKSIYYSPSGLLNKISFAALAENKTTFLCDAFDLHQMGSISQLAQNTSFNPSSSQTAYLIGGINYNTDTSKHDVWPYLPNTLAETKSIYDHLNQNDYLVERYFGSEANEELIKKIANQASILHISTHGYFFPDPEKIKSDLKDATFNQEEIFFRGLNEEEVSRSTSLYAQWNFINNQNPLMRSGILLAGANDIWQRSGLKDGEDGVLTAAEVANLDMHNTSLVVLSACETGLGDIRGSEGVFGLQRSFRMAGVQNLIISLWQVPDIETAEFMTTFYEYLVKYQDIQKAFVKTQKEMKKKYDPFYWAAFVLIES